MAKLSLPISASFTAFLILCLSIDSAFFLPVRQMV